MARILPTGALPIAAALFCVCGCATTYEERLVDGTTKSSTYYPWNDPNRRNSKPTPQLQMAYAKYAESQGNSEKARELYETSLKRDPDAVEAHVGLARLDYLGGKKEEARRRLEEARKKSPRSPEVLAAIAELHANERQYPEAIALYQQALDVSSGNQSIRYQYAVTLAKSGQNDAALGQFAQAVGAAAAHYNLGLILHEQGDLTAAEAQFVAALVKNPKLDQAQGWLDDTRREMERTQGSRVATASHQRPAFGADTSPVISELPTESRRDDPLSAAPATTRTPTRPAVPVGGHSGIASPPPANVATPASSFVPPAGPSGQPPVPPPGLTPAQREQWANQFSGGAR
jgi:tetratricopeptide (TPR) repeat protein